MFKAEEFENDFETQLTEKKKTNEFRDVEETMSGIIQNLLAGAGYPNIFNSGSGTFELNDQTTRTRFTVTVTRKESMDVNTGGLGAN